MRNKELAIFLLCKISITNKHAYACYRTHVIFCVIKYESDITITIPDALEYV